jgi:hypothetical protein
MMQIPEFWDMYGTTAPNLGRFDAKFGLRSPLLGFALFGPKTAILVMPNLAGSGINALYGYASYVDFRLQLCFRVPGLSVVLNFLHLAWPWPA